MIRKIVTALILVSLAILFAMFAVANRQGVTISLDPFNQADPAMALPPQPLYLVLLIVLIVGVLLIVFVVIAPNGIVGLVQGWKRARFR